QKETKGDKKKEETKGDKRKRERERRQKNKEKGDKRRQDNLLTHLRSIQCTRGFKGSCRGRGPTASLSIVSLQSKRTFKTRGLGSSHCSSLSTAAANTCCRFSRSITTVSAPQETHNKEAP